MAKDSSIDCFINKCLMQNFATMKEIDNNSVRRATFNESLSSVLKSNTKSSPIEYASAPRPVFL